MNRWRESGASTKNSLIKSIRRCAAPRLPWRSAVKFYSDATLRRYGYQDIGGKLRLASFADAQKLVKEGSNLYSAGQGAAAQPDTTSRVRQGFIEKSNVNSVHEMSRMVEITRTYTQISALLQQQHDLHRTAVEKLAEVPA